MKIFLSMIIAIVLIVAPVTQSYASEKPNNYLNRECSIFVFYETRFGSTKTCTSNNYKKSMEKYIPLGYLNFDVKFNRTITDNDVRNVVIEATSLTNIKLLNYQYINYNTNVNWSKSLYSINYSADNSVNIIHVCIELHDVLKDYRHNKFIDMKNCLINNLNGDFSTIVIDFNSTKNDKDINKVVRKIKKWIKCKIDLDLKSVSVNGDYEVVAIVHTE